MDDIDITDSRQGRALERISIFVEACGLTRTERRLAAEAVLPNHDWTYAIVTEAAAAGHQGFADHSSLANAIADQARAAVPAPRTAVQACLSDPHGRR